MTELKVPATRLKVFWGQFSSWVAKPAPANKITFVVRYSLCQIQEYFPRTAGEGEPECGTFRPDGSSEPARRIQVQPPRPLGGVDKFCS